MVSKQELEQLDKLEGYQDLYEREIVEVEDEKENRYDAVAYTMVEKDHNDYIYTNVGHRL